MLSLLDVDSSFSLNSLNIESIWSFISESVKCYRPIYPKSEIKTYNVQNGCPLNLSINKIVCNHYRENVGNMVPCPTKRCNAEEM